MARTKEPQYERTLEVSETAGVAKLGLMTNQTWHDDPKRLLFVLARYKFVAKLFQGYDSVLEVGCADAFGTRIIRQHVPAVTAIDFDPVFVEDVQARMSDSWPFSCFVHDILQGPVPGAFQGAYSLDVIEHIDKKNEELFMSNISDSLHLGRSVNYWNAFNSVPVLRIPQQQRGPYQLQKCRGAKKPSAAIFP